MLTPPSQSVDSSSVYDQQTQKLEDPYSPELEKYRRDNVYGVQLVSDHEFAVQCGKFAQQDNPGQSAHDYLESTYKDIVGQIKSLFEGNLLHPIKIPPDVWRACHQHDTLLGLARMGLIFVEKLVDETREVLQDMQEQMPSTISPSLRRSARLSRISKSNKNASSCKGDNITKNTTCRKKRQKLRRPNIVGTPNRSRQKLDFTRKESKTLRKNDPMAFASIIRPHSPK
jgi:hypothetical protein